MRLRLRLCLPSRAGRYVPLAIIALASCAVGPQLPSERFQMPSMEEMEARAMRGMGRAPLPKAPAAVDGIEVVVPRGHSASFTGVTLSPDGRSILSLSRDDTVKLWDVASGRELRTFAGFEAMWMQQAAFTRDGKKAVVADGGIVHVYDAASGRELARFGAGTTNLSLVSADGRHAVIVERSAGDAPLVVIDIAAGKPLWTLPRDGLQSPFLLSGDGRILLTQKLDTKTAVALAEDRYELLIWDVPARKLVGRMPFSPQDTPVKALSADGRYLAFESMTDRTVRIVDLQTRKETRRFAPVKGIAWVSNMLAFSRDGRFFAAAGDGGARVWELASGRLVSEVPAAAVGFSDDGATLVLGPAGGGAPVLRELASGKETKLAGGSASVSDLAVLPRSRQALAGMHDGSARLWDLASGQIVRSFACTGGAGVSNVAASPDERLAALACADGSVALWELATGRRVRELHAPTSTFGNTLARFSADGRLLYVAIADKVSVWDVAGAKMLRQFAIPVRRTPLMDLPASQMPPEQAAQMAELQERIMAMAVQPGGRLIAVANAGGVGLWDGASGKLVRALGGRSLAGSRGPQMRQVPQEQREALGDLFSNMPGGIQGLFPGRGQTPPVMITDPDEAAAALELPLTSRSLAFSADGRWLMTGRRLWDTATGQEIGVRPVLPAFTPNTTDANELMRQMNESMSGFLEDATSQTEVMGSGAAFSPDGSLTARGVGRVVRITQVADGRDRMELVGHSANVTSAAYSQDGRLILSGAEDGTLKLWEAASGKEVVSLMGLGRDEFVAVTPDQYYRASKGSAKNVSFRARGQLYPFEQFDLRFNRPDIVMQRLGGAAPEAIQSYRLAYERRLKKMGLTEQMLGSEFHVPELEILTPEVPVSVDAAALPLRVRARDGRYPLDRLNVYVNDVPVHGTQGIALRERKLQSHEQELSVPLLPGRNKIQVSVMNQQGTESLRQTVYTTSTAKAAPADTYVLAIGVSEYQDRNFNLRFAAKDAVDLAAAYQASEGKRQGWGKVQVLSLTDRRATRAEILKAKEWLARSKPNDLIVVFAAGHGVTDAQANYYFGTHDIDHANPAARGLPYDEFELLLDGVPAMQKLLLLDTCFSGEIEKDQPVAIASASSAGTRAGTVRMRSFKAARGVSVVPDSGGAARLSSAMLAFQQDWFADLRRGTGAAVISSSSGNEYSLEGEQWRNGVFTYAVLQGLRNRMADANRDGIVTVSELQAYVIEQVRALTQGGQNPTVRRENLEHDFTVY